jgi:hypothetical protein
MPVSQRQLEANRANAQKSTGPRSTAGRQRSSQNARRHGITAQVTIMTEEDRAKFDQFCKEMIAELAPEGALELFHAASAAEQAWRMQDARAKCNNIIALGHFDGTGDMYEADNPETNAALTAAQTVLEHAKTLGLISLYEQRIQRSFQKHCDELRQLQAEREATRKAQLEQARLLYQLAELKNLPYDPAADGFVFSNREIALYTERFHREQLAKEANIMYRKQHSGHRELSKAA